MNSIDVAVIDYGIGNLLSVRRGFEHCGATVNVTSDPKVILSSARVVLPGVGAFANGMAGLRRNALDRIVQEVAASGTPLLGICLGMQMLMDESEEFGVHPGLGLIPGRVIPVPSITPEGHTQKIPHIGWNGLVLSQSRKDWQSTILEDTQPDEAAYFVHSFMASPADPLDRIADCTYGGGRVSAVVGRKNVFGCQFHPEKSGKVGLTILRRFLKL